MMFSLVTAGVAMQSFALRPQTSMTAHASIAGLVESLEANPTEGMSFIKAASSVVDEIMLQTGNATGHLDDGQELTLEQVIVLVRKQMYKSMEADHDRDVLDLKAAIRAIEQCNFGIEARQSATGDLGRIHQEAIELQYEANRLQGVVDERRQENDTMWEKFEDHMMMISEPPPCPSLPSPRSQGTLDVYFASSPYSLWWTARRSPYFARRDDYLAADEALREAIEALNIHRVSLEIKYCDWKTELKAACADFDRCFAETSGYYSNTLVPRVQRAVHKRSEIYKAGELLIVQVEFLLARRESREAPEADASHFQIDFPAVPNKALCDLTPLQSDTWNPPIDCSKITATMVSYEHLANGGVGGGCYADDWQEGEHNLYFHKSLEQCKRLCDWDSTCMGIEWHHNLVGRCEIHTEAIHGSAYALGQTSVIDCYRKLTIVHQLYPEQ